MLADDNTLFVSIQNEKFVTEIDLGSGIKGTLPFIIQKMRSNTVLKQSEPNNVIITANFSKTKISTIARKDSNLVNQLAKILWKSSNSNDFIKKELKNTNRRIKLTTKKRMSKIFVNHVGYLRSVIEEFQSSDISSSLKVANAKLSDCVNSMH